MQDKLLKKEEQIQKLETEKSVKRIKRETEFEARKEKRTITKEKLDQEYDDLVS